MTATRVARSLLAIALAACHGGRLTDGATVPPACVDPGADDCAAVQGDIIGTAGTGPGATPWNGAGSGGMQGSHGSAGAPVPSAGASGAVSNAGAGGAAGEHAGVDAGADAAATAGAGGGLATGGGAGGGDTGGGGGGGEADPEGDSGAATGPLPGAPLYVAPRVVFVGEPRSVRIFGAGLDDANGAAVFVDGEQVGTLTALSAREGRVTLPGLARGEHFLSIGEALAAERARLFTAERVHYPDDEVAIPGLAQGLVYDAERNAFFGVFDRQLGYDAARVLARVQFDGDDWRVDEIDVPSPVDVAMTPDGRALLVSNEGCVLARVDPDTLARGDFEPVGSDCWTGGHLIRSMADGQLLYGSYEGLWNYASGERTTAPYLNSVVSILSQHQTQMIWAEGPTTTGMHPLYSHAVASETFDNVRTLGGDDYRASVLAVSGDGDRFLHHDDVYDRGFRYLGRLGTTWSTPEPLALSGDGSVAIALDAAGLRAFDVSGLVGPFPALGATVPFSADQFGRMDRLATDDTGETAFGFAARTLDSYGYQYEFQLVVRNMLDGPAPPVQGGGPEPGMDPGEAAAALYVAPRTVFADEGRSARLFGTNAGIRNGQQVWVDGQAAGTLTSTHAREAQLTLPPLAAGEHSLRIGDATAGVPSGPQARVFAVPRVRYDDAEVALPGAVARLVYDVERSAFFVVFASAVVARIQFDGALWRLDEIDLPSARSLAMNADGRELLVMAGGSVLAHVDPDSLSVMATDNLPTDVFTGDYDTVAALADGQMFYGHATAITSLFRYPSHAPVQAPYVYGAEIFVSQDQTRLLWAEWYSVSPPHPIHAYAAGDTLFELLRASGENTEYLPSSLTLSADGGKLVHYGSVYDASFSPVGDLALGGVLPWAVGLSGDGLVAATFDYSAQSLRAFDVSAGAGPFMQRGEAIPFPIESLGLPRRLVLDDDGQTAFAWTDSFLVIRRLPPP